MAQIMGQAAQSTKEQDMADRRLDFTIGVNADTGKAEIGKVSAELKGLGGASEESKKKLEGLAQQQKLIDSFVQLKRANGEAAAALQDAQDKAQRLGREFSQLDAPTKKQSAEMRRAGQEVQTAKAAYQQSTLALQNMRGSLAQNGVSTSNLAGAQVQLRGALAAARAEAQASAAANEKTASSHRKMAEGVQSISTQLEGLKNGALALAGVNIGAGMIRDLGQTADAVKNLQGRLQLAIGESGDLGAVWQQVGDVALRTHSSLETTGELFAKLVKAGTDAGLGTQQAITQSLQLTETINQAVQLSGASAQASDAAITQLIQGLQSGVLRGDEFNSVMEQAPRLADALTASLGLTRGQLREMAQDGKLSAQTVIEALRQQSGVVAAEFAAMPLTIGRAVTDLQTKWAQFVGGLDKTSAASALVAEGIAGIAGHLDLLADMAGRAGMVLLASLAVQGVSALRALAAEMAITGGAAGLLKANLEKIPKTLQITVAAVGFEVGYQIGTMLYNNSELVRKLGVGMNMYFQNQIASLMALKDAAAAIFTDDTLEAVFQRYRAKLVEIRSISADMWDDAKNDPQEAAAGINQAGQAAQQTGQAVTALSGQILQLGRSSDELATKQAEQIKNSEKMAQASKAEGDALVALAQLRGNEAALVAAQAQAATAAAAQGQTLLGQKQALLKTYQDELAAINALIGDSAKEREAHKTTIDELQKKIAAQQAEVAQAEASAKATEQAALAASLAAEKLKDHSGQVDALRMAWELAGQQLAKVQADFAAGKASQEQLQAATENLTRAEVLYKDALADSAEKLKTKHELAKTNLSIEQLALQGKMDAINIEIKLARLAGDEQRVKELLIAQKRIEIEQIKLSVKVKNLEADAAIATAQATMAELAASGKLTPEKKAEIDATIKLAKAKKELNAIKLQEVQLHEREINVLKGNTSGKRDNANSSKDAAEGIKRERTEREKNADAIQQENDRLKDLGLTRMGGGYMNKDKMATDRDGKVIQAAGWTRKQIIDWLVQFGMDSKLAEEQAKDFIDGYGNVQYMNNAGQLKWAGKGSTLTQALAKMGDYFVYGDGKAQNEKAKAGGQADSLGATRHTTGAGNTYVSNITLNGQTTAIKFADATSQQQAEALLRELAAAKGASY